MEEKVPNLLAITVSTRYDDILRVVIHQNQRFFRRWYIVTHEDDMRTINVIQKANYPHIEILYFDFYKNATFNKGGAIQYAQKHIEHYYRNTTIMILDSDIFLPDNFYSQMAKFVPQPDTLYGVSKRYDYGSYMDFIEDVNPYDYPSADKFFGFFQLYKQSPFKVYPNSQNCSQCDTAFLQYFTHKRTLPLTVKHLGKAATHWDGRTDTRDFLMNV
jgi:hypothetical protein